MRKEINYCDRCHKRIENESPFWVGIGMILNTVFLGIQFRDLDIDLCENCSKSLKDWLKGKKNERM